MNKYFVEIPYSCATYGVVKGYVYANSEDEAEVRAGDIDNLEDPEYDDQDTDNTQHEFDRMELSLRAENVPDNQIPEYLHGLMTPDIPEYFLSEINLI